MRGSGEPFITPVSVILRPWGRVEEIQHTSQTQSPLTLSTLRRPRIVWLQRLAPTIALENLSPLWSHNSLHFRTNPRTFKEIIIISFPSLLNQKPSSTTTH